MTIEEHPLEPFLPEKAKILFLGSFPPPKARWSMEFFYPNWINDFWRIQGLIHFADKHYFEAVGAESGMLQTINVKQSYKLITHSPKRYSQGLRTQR